MNRVGVSKSQPSLESRTRVCNHVPGWCVDAQSSTTLESENKNRQGVVTPGQNSKMGGKPMLTVSQFVTEHPFELQQEVKVPELAPTISVLDSSGDKRQIS